MFMMNYFEHVFFFMYSLYPSGNWCKPSFNAMDGYTYDCWLLNIELIFNWVRMQHNLISTSVIYFQYNKKLLLLLFKLNNKSRYLVIFNSNKLFNLLWSTLSIIEINNSANHWSSFLQIHMSFSDDKLKDRTFLYTSECN